MARYDQIAIALPIFRALRTAGLMENWPDAQARCAVALDVFTDRLEIAFEEQPSLEERRLELLEHARGGESVRRSKFDGIIYKTALRFARKLYTLAPLREQAFASLAGDTNGWGTEPWRHWLRFVAQETISNIYATYHTIRRDPNLPSLGVATDSFGYWLNNGKGWEDDRFQPEEVVPWTIQSIRAYLLYAIKHEELHQKLLINWPFIVGVPDLEMHEGAERQEYDYMENTAWLDAKAPESTQIEKITPEKGLELILADFEQDVALLAAHFGTDAAL